MKMNLYCVLVLVFGLNLYAKGMPVYDPSTGQLYHNITSLDEIPGYNGTNGSAKEIYVIKAVVYEIGILTEVDENDTDTSSDSGESQQVDLTFYDAHKNGSQLNLGDIPLPIQQQINGQIITGIAPVHFGQVNTPEDILQTLPLTGTIINITDSHNAVINLSTHNVSSDGEPTVIHNLNFNNIPVVGNTIPILPSAVQNAPIFEPVEALPDNN